jgi:hypothetical protein
LQVPTIWTWQFAGAHVTNLLFCGGLHCCCCRLALLQLSTRTFSYGGTEVLLPILDLANHDNACLHTHDAEPCDLQKANELRKAGLLPVNVPDSLGSGKVVPYEAETATDSKPATAAQTCKCGKGGCDEKAGSSDRSTADAKLRGVSGICIFWRAETKVAKGGEVCNNYGLLLQDNALFQYGYLQVRQAWFSSVVQAFLLVDICFVSVLLCVLAAGGDSKHLGLSRSLQRLEGEYTVAKGWRGVCDSYRLLLQDNALF